MTKPPAAQPTAADARTFPGAVANPRRTQI
jgi:hypothetical protein